MWSYEYVCKNCGYHWTEISAYPTHECPECDAEIDQPIWQGKAYD